MAIASRCCASKRTASPRYASPRWSGKASGRDRLQPQAQPAIASLFYPGNIDSAILPGYILRQHAGLTPMTSASLIAFAGSRRIAQGDALAVALAVRQTRDRGEAAPILVFE